MKKILLGALVCAVVAGVVYYFYDPKKFKEAVDDLKSRADDLLDKAKDMTAGQKSSSEGLRCRVMPALTKACRHSSTE